MWGIKKIKKRGPKFEKSSCKTKKYQKYFWSIFCWLLGFGSKFLLFRLLSSKLMINPKNITWPELKSKKKQNKQRHQKQKFKQKRTGHKYVPDWESQRFPMGTDCSHTYCLATNPKLHRRNYRLFWQWKSLLQLSLSPVLIETEESMTEEHTTLQQLSTPLLTNHRGRPSSHTRTGEVKQTWRN